MVNIVPSFFCETKVILPPASVTMFLTMARPNPIPPDLVVKFGKNTLSNWSGGIQIPLSSIVTLEKSFS